MSVNKKREKSRASVYDKTIDFHGWTLDDALREIDALISSGRYKSILVIHGHGEGILKNGLRRYFGNSSMVKKIYSGDELCAMGGDGVTIVYL